MDIRSIEARRSRILEEMACIRSLNRGSLKEQMIPVKHKDKKEPVLRGPYYVLARWVDGKTRSKRVSKDELKVVQKDVENHRQFRKLCDEFAALTERLGELEREQEVSEAAVKKKPKSRSGKTTKSNE